MRSQAGYIGRPLGPRAHRHLGVKIASVQRDAEKADRVVKLRECVAEGKGQLQPDDSDHDAYHAALFVSLFLPFIQTARD